jgi:hypothetical protein
MRAGFAVLPIRDTQPTAVESSLISGVIREMHVTTVNEWLARQKPKIRSKFVRFLETVDNCPMPPVYSNFCVDIAERFGRDLIQPQFHPMLHPVLAESDGEFADVLHMLSMHMQRSNVVASMRSPRDRTAQLLKEIAEEDHVYSRPFVARHELPSYAVAQSLARGRMADPLPRMSPTRSCRPSGTERSTPFAMFPGLNSERLESVFRSQFVNYGVRERPSAKGVYCIFNGPTCL